MTRSGSRSLLFGVAMALGMAMGGALLGGCSATVAAPPRLDGVAKALAPPPGHALLYIVRPEFMGQAVRFDITVNGTWIGATGGFRYVFTYLKPGHYLIQSRAENIADLRITVHANRVYFVEQQPLMGMFGPGNALVLLPEAAGRQRLRHCALSTAMPREVLDYAMRVGQGGAGGASAGVATASGSPPGDPAMTPQAEPPKAKRSQLPPRPLPGDPSAPPPAGEPLPKPESF